MHLQLLGFYFLMSFAAISYGLDVGQSQKIQMTGLSVTTTSGTSSTIPNNISAVSLNVTAVDAKGAGFLTVWPCSAARPLASSLNFSVGDVVPNGIIAPVGTDGSVCFYSSATTDLIVDVAGWFQGELFVGATPKRLVDSRDGTGSPIAKITSSTILTIPIAGVSTTTSSGTATIPSSLSAAALNVTVVNPGAAGFVTVYPCGESRPLASNVNYIAGQVVANGVVAPVGANGDVCIYSSMPADIVVDLAGWFVGTKFVGAVPNRLVDTRDGTGGFVGRASSDLSVSIRGKSLSVKGFQQTVPSSATAAALNVTAVTPDAAGFVTVWPCGVARPNASNLNYVSGDVVANNVIAPIGSDGSVCVYTQSTTDIIVDIAGWFESSSTEGFFGITPKRLFDSRELNSDGDGIFNFDPVFDLSSTCFSVPENTLAVCTIAATDADGDSLTFTLSGGSDSPDLQLIAGNKLVFVNPPDYESPVDNEQNNTYIVIVTVADGFTTVSHTMTINVTNVEEKIFDELRFDTGIFN
jgi:hypothetical protein|tara:strand:+ start:189 stop:1760 length:1572 start_codon:yes stop_codon:yes gene_type:complete